MEFGQFLLPFLTLVGSLIIVISAIYLALFFTILKKKHLGIARNIANLVRKNGLVMALIVALASTLGSLFYSEILGFDPCRLCWYQRILMYPLVIILGVAVKNKAQDVGKYVIPLGVVGGAIAAFHYYSQFTTQITVCGSLNAVDCSVRYTFEYGFITIPMMALVGFILIIAAVHVVKKHIEYR